MNCLSNIKKSLLLNYKSWFFLVIALILISLKDLTGCAMNLGKGFATFGILFVASHVLHYWAHFKRAYPQNIVHLYHHEHNNFFSHFLQIIVEFVSAMSYMWLKYNVSYMSFFNEWIIIFYYLFYTTIHNINYSILHVNNVHELHHKFRIKNMGPDICDIMFGTKYNVEDGIENTDHYIPNIIICLIITMLLKSFWDGRENKAPYEIALKYIFGGCIGLLTLSTMYLVYEGKIKNEEHPEPEAAPAKEPEAAPEKEPEAAPEKEPEAAPTKEPEAAPAKEPETVKPSETE